MMQQIECLSSRDSSDAEAASSFAEAGARRVPQPTGGKALAPQLHKTKLCSYHIAGHCRLGSACDFAHDVMELRTVPDLRKTRLCRSYAAGRCTDEHCGFAHGQAELRATGSFYKRALCKFHQRGNCRNKDQCRFAHGLCELRKEVPQAPRHAGGAHADVAPAMPRVYEPMKVPLPSIEVQVSVLDAAMMQETMAWLALLGAKDLQAAHALMEAARHIDGEMPDIWRHAEVPPLPRSAPTAPPGLTMAGSGCPSDGGSGGVHLPMVFAALEAPSDGGDVLLAGGRRRMWTFRARPSSKSCGGSQLF
eukprot:CAMPEP_0176032578 /NCGR_PEP_ID=MMETSP0120_2-20121206/16081_1 /TAXON_ID=160619 /ORGANISM="Kryptoperidinium foliaceum, Strain CCMP 1326" /LENGTH=305 /DNA_ID=CAMNT_0017365895 /DNA_START=71 /DNA_END=989 /DNA_ORIENTATION=+